MKLNTKHFGIIEIDENGIIDFPEGLPAFEDVKRFILLGNSDQDSAFQWLQGVDNAELAFVVIDPKHIKPDYIVDIDDSEVDILAISDVNKVLVYSIVVIPQDISKMTANLKAPVLVNTENRRGKQVVMEKGNYGIRHYVLDELQKIGGQR
jgi:flagellar assembly factor FliW